MRRSRYRLCPRLMALTALLLALMLALAACGGSSPAADDTAEDIPDEAADVEVDEPPAGPMVVTTSIVRGHENVPDDEVCVVDSRYRHNEMIVWRIKVIDPATGEQLTDEDLTSVTVVFADGQTFEAEYGDHPKDNPTDQFWATSWTIPADYPSGVLDYDIEVEAEEGRDSRLVGFNVRPALLTITDEAVPVEGEGD